MDFAHFKIIRNELNREMDVCSEAMQIFPRNQNGLTPDHVKATQEWKEARARSDMAFWKVRKFNGTYAKQFKEEIKKELADKREAKLAAAPKPHIN